MDEFGHRFPSLLADGGLWVVWVCNVRRPLAVSMRPQQYCGSSTRAPRPCPTPHAGSYVCGLADPAMVWPQANLRRSKTLDVTPWLVTHVVRENGAYGLTSFLSRPTMPHHATRPHAGRETDA